MKYPEQVQIFFVAIAVLLVVLNLVFSAGIVLLIPAILAFALCYIIPEFLEERTKTLEIVTTIDNSEEASS